MTMTLAEAIAEVQRVEPETLRKLLRYEAETGKLYWRARPLTMFVDPAKGRTWNTRRADKEAFTTKNSEGYHHGFILSRVYKAHRVAWAIVHGAWPQEEIDHINGVRSDNRLINLRAATRSENIHNRPSPITNTSGAKGATWKAAHSRWSAQIRVHGKQKHLGYFATREEAAAAYATANAALHGQFGRT